MDKNDIKYNWTETLESLQGLKEALDHLCLDIQCDIDEKLQIIGSLDYLSDSSKEKLTLIQTDLQHIVNNRSDYINYIDHLIDDLRPRFF